MQYKYIITSLVCLSSSSNPFQLMCSEFPSSKIARYHEVSAFLTI